MRHELPKSEKKGQVFLGIQNKYIDAIGGVSDCKEIAESYLVKKAKKILKEK